MKHKHTCTHCNMEDEVDIQNGFADKVILFSTIEGKTVEFGLSDVKFNDVEKNDIVELSVKVIAKQVTKAKNEDTPKIVGEVVKISHMNIKKL